MLNHVNHEAAHLMIQALSMTDEGSKLIKELENIRYYHRGAQIHHRLLRGLIADHLRLTLNNLT